jgi:hypothetical protein
MSKLYRMQDQVMKEADAGRAGKHDEQLDGMHDCASRYEGTVRFDQYRESIPEHLGAPHDDTRVAVTASCF